ncbi:MAG: hypothetical protein ACRDU0_14935, partial [Mycobacterium sp.]
RSLIDAAFRSYLDGVSALLDELEREAEGRSVGDVINLLVEIERRSFEDAHVILAEYELVLAAARDSELARAFVAWERLVIGRLAEALESLGAPRPFEAARTVLQLMRGSELDRLTRPEAGDDEFRARLEVLIPALLSHAAHEDATVVRAPSTTTTAPATAGRDQHTGGPRAHRTPRSKR